MLNRVKMEKEAFLLSSVFATRAASSAVAFVAAGVGQRSLGRAAAAHTLYERRPRYERCEMEMGCGMWRAERNMSDGEESGGRYWQVGLPFSMYEQSRVGWTGPLSAPWYIRSSMIHEGT